MTLLRDDSFSRRPSDTRRRAGPGVTAFVLMLLSVALLVLSRIEHPLVQSLRRGLAEIVAPAIGPVAEAVAPARRIGRQLVSVWDQAGEIDRLREENQRLRTWEARARELERQLADLGTVARLVEEQTVPSLTARVIADANGPFSRSVLIDAGRNAGIRDGYPALSADGLVGRVVDAGPQAARLLLLTDVSSRIPVLIGESTVRAILTGDNTGRPRITHLPADAMPAPGELVVTSSVGGQFPRGLRVGVVVRDGRGLRVDLDARLDALEHLSILQHAVPDLRSGTDERRDSRAVDLTNSKLARRMGGADTASPAASRQR
jgi:rod shape-determining protein MreC